MLVLRRQVFKSGLPERLCSRVTGASLFGSLIPANSKTAWRSRQFPAIAPGIAASAGWIRRFLSSSRPCPRMDRERSFAPSELDCFRVLSHGLRRGLRSFAAPRLGSVVVLLCMAFCSAARGSAWVSRWGCRGLAGGGARAPGFEGGPNSGYSIRYCGRSRDFAHHQLLADPVMDVVQAGVFCVPRGDPHCCPLTFMWMHLRTLGWG
jgi:hypothetical protein